MKLKKQKGKKMNKNLENAIQMIQQCKNSRICPIMIQDILQDAEDELKSVRRLFRY